MTYHAVMSDPATRARAKQPLAPTGGLVLRVDQLETIRDLLADQYGFWVRDAWLPQLQTRVVARMQETQAVDFDGYYAILRNSAGFHGELYRLFEDLSIHETQFNRATGQFDVLREKILPELIEAKNGGKLRLASFACSTGEEPYTLAMTVCETLYGCDSNSVEIIGLDVSARALESARQARYAEFQLRDLQSSRRARWFEHEEGYWRPKLELRRLVRFHRHNLATPLPLSGLDVIFCRNALIYFRPALVKQLLAAFHAALNPGGYLFLGHAETTHACPELFEAQYTSDVAYYRRLTPTTATTGHLKPSSNHRYE